MKAALFYKIGGAILGLAVVSFGGYHGFVAFQAYQTNAINAAVSARTGDLEAQLANAQSAIDAASSASADATTTASSTVNDQVGQLQAQITALQSGQGKANANAAATVGALQKQIADLKASAATVQAAATTAISATPLTTAQIIAKVSPSVVLIRTNLGCGSGMVVESNGLILTDNHVVSGANNILVYLSDGSAYPAKVGTVNLDQDLATLQIKATGLKPVTFDSSSDSNLPLGSSVISLGYPTTCNNDQTLEADAGTITARRTVPTFAFLGQLLQTSALMNPGASGGPLVDQEGRVVGLNELAETLGLDVNVTDISYATQADVAISFLTGGPDTGDQVIPAAGTLSSAGIITSQGGGKFTITGVGMYANTGCAALLLEGYPLVNNYTIPPDDITSWSDSKIVFSLASAPALPPGTYKVLIRIDNNLTNSCTDILGSGTVTTG